MPEAVLSYRTQNDFKEVRIIQKRILTAYKHDFSKHAPSGIVPRIRMLWNSILEGNAIFEEFKGALTEQYVLQQLTTIADLVIYYSNLPLYAISELGELS